jgi:nucleoside 2-deoxyribosyltransferase
VTAYYLAARYGRRLEVAEYADQLRSLGHQVTSRWLLGQHQADELEVAAAGAVHEVPEIARRFAEEDVEDVTFADVVVAFSEPPRSSASRGGRHVEFGMALGWVLAGYTTVDGRARRVAVIGQRENVFHCLPDVAVFPDWSSFLATVEPVPQPEEAVR